jgi:hypothetical protein
MCDELLEFWCVQVAAYSGHLLIQNLGQSAATNAFHPETSDFSDIACCVNPQA